jgi:hypothetical protein
MGIPFVTCVRMLGRNKGPLLLIFLWVLLGQLDLFFKGTTRLNFNYILIIYTYRII